MTLAAIIGTLTIFVSFLVKVVGFPSQVRLLFKTRDTSSISMSLFTLTFLSYILWTIHGCIKGDMVLIVGHGLGVITSGFLIGQIMYLRKEN